MKREVPYTIKLEENCPLHFEVSNYDYFVQIFGKDTPNGEKQIEPYGDIATIIRDEIKSWIDAGEAPTEFMANYSTTSFAQFKFEKYLEDELGQVTFVYEFLGTGS